MIMAVKYSQSSFDIDGGLQLGFILSDRGGTAHTRRITIPRTLRMFGVPQQWRVWLLLELSASAGGIDS